MIKKFINDEAGATAIEYGLITALVAVGIILSLTELRDALRAVLELISQTLQSA